MAAPLPEWVPYTAQSPEEPQRESQQLLMLSAINFRLWLMSCSQLIHGKDTSLFCNVMGALVFFLTKDDILNKSEISSCVEFDIEREHYLLSSGMSDALSQTKANPLTPTMN